MALAVYTESGGKGRTAVDQEEAVEVMLEKYEVCCVLFHGFDWPLWTRGTAQTKESSSACMFLSILKEESAIAGRSKVQRLTKSN